MSEPAECTYRHRITIIGTGDLSTQGFPDVQTDGEEVVLFCNLLIRMGGHRHSCLVIDQNHTTCPIARFHEGDADAQLEIEPLLLSDLIETLT